jgi:hypothetical protein
VYAGIGDGRPTHRRGEVLWLHLQTYIRGLPVRTKDEWYASTMQFDKLLLYHRDRAVTVLYGE